MLEKVKQALDIYNFGETNEFRYGADKLRIIRWAKLMIIKFSILRDITLDNQLVVTKVTGPPMPCQ